jgi:hypothetical protein
LLQARVQDLVQGDAMGSFAELSDEQSAAISERLDLPIRYCNLGLNRKRGEGKDVDI